MSVTTKVSIKHKKSSSSTALVNDTKKKLNGSSHQKISHASVQEFSSLKDISGYNNEELATLVGITHRTIRNKKSNNELFDIAQTERLRKLNLLFSEGNEVFGDTDQFHNWLQKPAYGLDYNTPDELLKQPGGLDKVLNEVRGIKYGDTI